MCLLCTYFFFFHFSANVKSKLTPDPYETRGEEIQTRYEDDYKFHRYTNRYGNAFGSQFYTISITCRSIFTDPEIYKKLHDTHYEQQSRYYGYWYGLDLNALDPQAKASETNALVEASLAGSWLCFASLIAGLVLMIIQRYDIMVCKLDNFSCNLILREINFGERTDFETLNSTTLILRNFQNANITHF